MEATQGQSKSKSQSPRVDIAALKPTIDKFQAVRRDIEQFVFEREDAIKMCCLALLAGEHVLLEGPPGTAKSMIVNQLTQRITGAQMFETLMHPMVTDRDLFVSHTTTELTTDANGNQSINVLYHTDGGTTLATAQIAFLDEVFKASPRALNTLLTLMNERKYDLNRQRHDAALMSAFFASNELPEIDGSDGLAAFFDRILIRVPIGPIRQPDNQIKVFKTQLAHRRNLATGKTVSMDTIDLADLKLLQQQVSLIYVPNEVFEKLIKLADLVSKNTDMYISQRRVERTLKVLQARALFAGRPEVSVKDLTILRFMFWEDPEKFDQAEKLIRDNVLDPIERKVDEIKDAAFEYVRSAEKRGKDGDLWDDGFVEELRGIQGCLDQLNDLARSNQLKASVKKQIDELRDEIIEARAGIVINQES